MTDTPHTLELRLGEVAHGGHVVARTAEGRVVFVRHGLPGELARVALTDRQPDASFWRGDVVEVVDPAPGRREHHVWSRADALLAAAEGRKPVGGAEFGHADLATQRELKRRVLAEQLLHLAGHEWQGRVHPTNGETPDGTGWRTRLHLDVAADGTPGMHPHRSNELVTLQDMPLASAPIQALAPWALRVEGAERLDVSAPSNGRTPLLHVSLRADAHERQLDALRALLGEWGSAHGVSVTARSADHRRVATWAGTGEVLETLEWPASADTSGEAPQPLQWRVSPTGFWQIHREAPAALAGTVLAGADLRAGDTVWDLYSGAGLFTAVAARAVGESGAVFAVEGSPVTSADAAHNLAHAPHVRSVRGDVARVLTGRGGHRQGERRRRGHRAASSAGTRVPRPDVVIMDPPRAGAAKEVLAAVDQAGPRTIVYVACDPAALGRDLGRLRRRGWKVEDVTALDLYPNTHHVEAVAVLRRDA